MSNAAGAAEVGMSVLAICMLGSLGVLGWQVYMWLQLGEWQSFSVLAALAMLTNPGIDSWLLFPHSWIGIHKLIAWMPAGFALFAFGVLFAFACLQVKD
jgi:hypothetical protein